MNVRPASLPGVLIIELDTFADGRGLFMETWRNDRYREMGIVGPFVQDNFSRSRRGVLRGLHYQLRRPQGKLVQVTRGAAWDVVVDIRVGAPTFGRWLGIELSSASPRQIWIPPGFAHGFLALSDDTDLLYKCTDTYVADDNHSLLWSDPELAIAWPLANLEPLVSEKDACAPPLREAADSLPRFDG